VNSCKEDELTKVMKWTNFIEKVKFPKSAQYSSFA